MQVFVVLTSKGIWSVCATRRIAEHERDIAMAEGGENVTIHECGVVEKRR